MEQSVALHSFEPRMAEDVHTPMNPAQLSFAMSMKGVNLSC